MSGLSRIFVGILGGFAASSSKVLALDIERLGRFVETGNLNDMHELKVAIYIFTPLLMLLGGLVAWASGEEQRMKLLAIGCAAPALLAPWTVGDINKGAARGEQYSQFSVVTQAYADEFGGNPNQSTFLKGLNALLGLSDINEQKYWVIVGSRKDNQEAEQFAFEINKVDPKIKAFVGKQRAGNEYFPIIVGGKNAYYPLDKAIELRKNAISIPIIPEDSYLSDFPDR
ncbi:MAG: hypothetical protein COB76_00965 [Alphaproteobacteria bacterium]|nr:MAG: hypothetical protein COB76_00965 [Alphaproteobacteria bacterium]